MTRIIDVAQYIVERQPDVDRMKLQKLCCYSQAWHLAWAGGRLFEEDMQGWTYGPVAPRLWKAVKLAENDARSSSAPVESIRSGDSARLSEYERAVIDAVVAHYGKLKGTVLSDKSHSTRTWRESRAGLTRTDRGNVPLSLKTLRAEAVESSMTGDSPTPPAIFPPVSADGLAAAVDRVERRNWDTLRALADL